MAHFPDRTAEAQESWRTAQSPSLEGREQTSGICRSCSLALHPPAPPGSAPGKIDPGREWQPLGQTQVGFRDLGRHTCVVKFAGKHGSKTGSWPHPPLWKEVLAWGWGVAERSHHPWWCLGRGRFVQRGWHPERAVGCGEDGRAGSDRPELTPPPLAWPWWEVGGQEAGPPRPHGPCLKASFLAFQEPAWLWYFLRRLRCLFWLWRGEGEASCTGKGKGLSLRRRGRPDKRVHACVVAAGKPAYSPLVGLCGVSRLWTASCTLDPQPWLKHNTRDP